MTNREVSGQLATAAAVARNRIAADRRGAGPKLAPLLAHIDRHLFDPALSVGRMKAACGVRDNSISSAFHRVIGQPPAAYIAARRLETAARMLRDTDLEVFRLSEILGYSSLQVFSRAFVRWSGQRPSVYRRRARRTRAGAPTPPQAPRPERRWAVPATFAAEPVRHLLSDDSVEQARAEAIWETVRERPTAEQAPMLQRAASASSALFRVVHEAARAAGRGDRAEGARLAELALDCLPRAELGRADDATAARKARAWAWVANARSLARDTHGADEAMAVAERWLPGETKAPEAQAEVRYLRACILKRRNQLELADEAIERAFAISRSLAGSSPLRISIAVMRASILLDHGRADDAIASLEIDLPGIEGMEDPYLRFSGLHTLACSYAYAGRSNEARALLPALRALLSEDAVRSVAPNVQALVGQIELAEGNDRRAEVHFKEAHRGFLAFGALAQAALAALDLAMICRKRGDHRSTREFALSAAVALERTEARRECLMALRILQDAAQAEEFSLGVIRAAKWEISPPIQRQLGGRR